MVIIYILKYVTKSSINIEHHNKKLKQTGNKKTKDTKTIEDNKNWH